MVGTSRWEAVFNVVVVYCFRRHRRRVVIIVVLFVVVIGQQVHDAAAWTDSSIGQYYAAAAVSSSVHYLSLSSFLVAHGVPLVLDVIVRPVLEQLGHGTPTVTEWGENQVLL
jgi:hypothetical protein